MALRGLISVPRRPVDPAEAWEVLLTEREAGPYFQDTYVSRPFTPRKHEELPAGSLESLTEVCGIEGLHQTLVIPWAVRPVGLGHREVVSPNSVLAVGTRAVGLWTEKPQPGLKVVIRIEEIAAIEDVIILLYGRLSFIPFAERLTIRYNTVGRRGFESALLALRRSIAGTAKSVPHDDGAPAALDYKWSNLVDSPVVQLNKGAGVNYRFASIRKRSGRNGERGQMVALTPYELVYLRDPDDDSVPYGEDSYLIPRGRLECVNSVREGLEVRSNGARLVLPMARELCQSAVRWLE